MVSRGSLFLVVAIGGVCSVTWVLLAEAGLVWQQARAAVPWLALPAVALTLANVLLRLIRWQFFLRRSGIRLPMRQSAGIFVAGLAMLLTPAYAGEGVKTWLVGRAQPDATGSTGRRDRSGNGEAPFKGSPLKGSRMKGWARATGTVLAERLFDAIALCLVGSSAFFLAGETAWGGTLGVAGLLGAGTMWIVLPRQSWGHLAVALLISVLAWLCGSLTLYAVCRGMRLDVTPLQAIGTYSASTLLGGLTLLPAGVGVVGTAMLIKLQGYGVPLQQAVLVAVLVRLLTVWLTAALGVAGCWRLWWGQRLAAPVTGSHFDALAADYAEQLSATARERVVGRKVALMLRALREGAIAPGARLLDAGCGHGWYVTALAGAGYRVTGIDLAPGQLAAARALSRGHAGGSPPCPFATASVLALPFAPGTFDAAFAVNLLHHAGNRAAQDVALAELARAVRPGGLIFVHEISTVNPLYRLYMAYLFPLWKRIDLGTEFWLDPRRPPRAPGVALDQVLYYTFLPDFTPRGLYRPLGPLEAWLERSRWAPYAAHFTAVYRRRPEPPPAGRSAPSGALSPRLPVVAKAMGAKAVGARA